MVSVVAKMKPNIENSRFVVLKFILKNIADSRDQKTDDKYGFPMP